MKKFQKICVTAFIFNDRNEVLLLKRSSKEEFLPNYWEMPGGKVEFGETPDEAIAREVFEETNLKIKAIKPYNLFSYVSQDEMRHTVDIQYLTKPGSSLSEIEISESHTDKKWTKIKNLNDLKISNLMKTSIEKGFKEINNN